MNTSKSPTQKNITNAKNSPNTTRKTFALVSALAHPYEALSALDEAQKIQILALLHSQKESTPEDRSERHDLLGTFAGLLSRFSSAHLDALIVILDSNTPDALAEDALIAHFGSKGAEAIPQIRSIRQQTRAEARLKAIMSELSPVGISFLEALVDSRDPNVALAHIARSHPGCSVEDLRLDMVIEAVRCLLSAALS